MGLRHPSEQRDPVQQKQLAGGRRKTDPPLTTRDCADWMGVEPGYIRAAIEAGHLKASSLPGERKNYRIYFDDFVAWLKAMHWHRLPKPGDDGQLA